ncbi:MAG: sporulation protein YunB [Halanaerobiaceae bacterium]|nr:sporulation protein YunB [Halanaerobiaceae bacterium]
MKLRIIKLNFRRVLFFFFALLIILFFIINKTISPLFLNLAEVEVHKIINKSINQAVREEAEKIDYRDMMKYMFNEQGDIIMMQPDTRYINQFTSRVSLAVERKLEELGREHVTIPFSRIMGIEILGGYGPDLKIRIVPAGYSIPPQLEDSFSSAGINQTRHKIYLKLSAKFKLIIPFCSKDIDVTADIPVTEVVIVGQVPEVYVGINQ